MHKTKALSATVIFLLCLSVFSGNVVAQSSSKNDFENAIANEFCDSFTKAAPHITKENTEIEIGLLFMPLMSRYSAKIKSEWGLSTEDSGSLYAIGKKVGQLAAFKCPAFLTFMKNNLQDDKKEEQITAKIYAGKLLKMEGHPFVYLLVQNKQGRTDKFYWLEFFEGAEKLSAKPATYLNKLLNIQYKETEVYQPTDREYKAIKVITKIVLD